MSAWKTAALAAECELCDMFDLVDGEGALLSQSTGRGEGLRLVKRPILPARIDGELGRVDHLSHALLWTIARVQELYHIAKKARAGGRTPQAAHTQWRNLITRFRRPTGPLEQLARAFPEWRCRVQAVGSFRLGDDEQVLMNIVDEARLQVRGRKRLMRDTQRASWRSWIAEQVRAGGGALHRYAKREVEKPEHAMTTPGGPSAFPQDQVDLDKDQWSAIWERLKGYATAPWRTDEISECHFEHAPETTAMRRSASSFKKITGIGGDHFAPIWFSWLSDPLLKAFGDFVVSAERAGRWPMMLEILLMHLIPKAAGGAPPHRSTGLSPSVVGKGTPASGPEVARQQPPRLELGSTWPQLRTGSVGSVGA